MTSEEYLALSQLVYADLNVDKEVFAEVKRILEDETRKDNLKTLIQKFDYSTLSDWVVLNSQNNNDTTGFCGAAVKNVKTGEIVFLMRGTEPETKDHLPIPEDIFTDAQLALKGEVIGKPNQFNQAYDFVKITIDPGNSMTDNQLAKYIQDNKISFTGHSLGGGLCQYLTYKTGGSSVTFNGVGIGQALDIEDYTKYPVIDYVNQDDIIGNYGKQLGETIYIQGNLYTPGVDMEAIASIVEMISITQSGILSKEVGTGIIGGMILQLNEESKAYLEAEMGTAAHGLELFLKEGTNTMKSERTNSNVKPLCDKLYALSVLVSEDIKDLGSLTLAEGLVLMGTGDLELINAGMHFVEHITQNISEQNIQMINEAIQIIDRGASKIGESIIQGGQDLAAIKENIQGGFTKINQEMKNLFQEKGSEFLEGIVFVGKGIVQLDNAAKMNNLALSVTAKVIFENKTIIEALVKEQQERMNNLINGTQMIYNGLIDAKQSISTGYDAMSEAISKEITSRFEPIKNNLVSLAESTQKIAMEINKGAIEIKQTVTEGVTNIKDTLEKEADAWWQDFSSGASKVAEGGMRICEACDKFLVMPDEAIAERIRDFVTIVTNGNGIDINDLINDWKGDQKYLEKISVENSNRARLTFKQKMQVDLDGLQEIAKRMDWLRRDLGIQRKETNQRMGTMINEIRMSYPEYGVQRGVMRWMNW